RHAGNEYAPAEAGDNGGAKEDGDQHAWDANANAPDNSGAVIIAATADADEYAGYANAVLIAESASLTSAKDANEYADAVGIARCFASADDNAGNEHAYAGSESIPRDAEYERHEEHVRDGRNEFGIVDGDAR